MGPLASFVFSKYKIFLIGVSFLITIDLTPRFDPYTPYTYVDRWYDGELYRQYYLQSGTVRYLTQIRRNGEWRDSGVDHQVAGMIQQRGSWASSGGSGQPGPFAGPLSGGGSRLASTTLVRRLYILSSSAKDEIVTVDPPSGNILARTELPRTNPFTLASLADDPRIFVVHQAQQAVGTIPASPPGITVFDKATSRIILNRALPATTFPSGDSGSLVLAVTPAGKRLYLLNNGEPSNVNGNLTFPKATIEVLDPDTLSTLASIATPQSGIGFDEIVASPDGTMLYSTTGTRLVVIDTLTNTVSTQIVASGDALVFHPNGTKLYFSRRTNIGVVDTATATLAGDIPVPGSVRLQQLVITPDGVDLFAQDDRSNKLYLIDLIQNKVSTSFPSTGANLLALAP